MNDQVSYIGSSVYLVFFVFYSTELEWASITYGWIYFFIRKRVFIHLYIKMELLD